MAEALLQPEIRGLIESKNFAQLKSVLCEREIHDLAELLGELEDEDLAMCFRLLPTEIAAEILGAFEPEQQEDLLTTLSSEKVAAILNEMPPDDRTELLEELPGELPQRLLNSLRGEERKIAQSLLAYPEDSIGRLMTPEYVAVRAGWSVERVFAHLREVAPTKETLNMIYVVDDRGKLVDELPLEQLVLAHPDDKVEDLMDRQAAALEAGDDREAAVEEFRKYDAIALPVVNRQGILVGIVTFDDVMDVAEEEVNEDFQKMAGMGPLEGSYFGTSWLGMVRKRLPWLILLLAAQTFTTVALLGFDKLPLFAVLVVFMPLVNSPAGNTGSQMAGLMIRGLAVQEIELHDWHRVLARELLRGLTLGLALALLGFVVARVFSVFLHPQGARVDPTQIALSVSVAIALAVTLANLVGSMLPFLFKRIGLDPAVTSAPFLASLMDISGILIYFTVATAVLAALG